MGVAQLGVAQLGVAQLGVAQLGVAQLGVAQLGVAQLGVAQLAENMRGRTFWRLLVRWRHCNDLRRDIGMSLIFLLWGLPEAMVRQW